MKEITVWAIISAILLVLFTASVTVSIMKKKLWLFITSLAILFVFMGALLITGYKIMGTSLKHISLFKKERTGKEIYTALLGQPKTECVAIISFHDQLIPRIDNAIYLHFETCPTELRRITALQNYRIEKRSTKGWVANEPSPQNNWFNPATLGDSVLVYEHVDEDKDDGQIMYVSTDSTKVFYKDMAD